jgi:hypothetical protein
VTKRKAPEDKLPQGRPTSYKAEYAELEGGATNFS